MAIFSNGDWLIHAAMAVYMVGLLVRDQLALRAFLFLGTGFYVAYYHLQPGAPPWDAIFASLMIGIANLIGLLRLLHSRYFTLLPAAENPFSPPCPAFSPASSAA